LIYFSEEHTTQKQHNAQSN